ncbi:MAG: hypothetical protein H6737_10025 [Alphaproteobacteria bacterium]|nr:hypothetical protein [Alphaproteobacteria bacterium]
MLLFALLACSTRFECGGKAEATVPGDLVCDGVVDCWGGQDERGDDCATELFYCDQPEPQAVLAGLVCDGVDDCNDGFDEASCP